MTALPSVTGTGAARVRVMLLGLVATLAVVLVIFHHGSSPHPVSGAVTAPSAGSTAPDAAAPAPAALPVSLPEAASAPASPTTPAGPPGNADTDGVLVLAAVLLAVLALARRSTDAASGAVPPPGPVVRPLLPAGVSGARRRPAVLRI